MRPPARSPRAAVVPALVLVVAGLVGACAAPGDATPPPEQGSATAVPTAVAPATPGATQAASPGTTGAPAAGDAARSALEATAWATSELTDVATGRPFRIADFAGRTVFVETMAIWCSNCRGQQARFRDALASIDPARVAYVVLTVDPGETAQALDRYRAEQGFTGTYALAGSEVAAALVESFGPNAVNPPSVPVVIVRPDGSVEFTTGPKSVEEIVALVAG